MAAMRGASVFEAGERWRGMFIFAVGLWDWFIWGEGQSMGRMAGYLLSEWTV